MPFPSAVSIIDLPSQSPWGVFSLRSCLAQCRSDRGNSRFTLLVYSMSLVRSQFLACYSSIPVSQSSQWNPETSPIFCQLSFTLFERMDVSNWITLAYSNSFNAPWHLKPSWTLNHLIDLLWLLKSNLFLHLTLGHFICEAGYSSKFPVLENRSVFRSPLKLYHTQLFSMKERWTYYLPSIIWDCPETIFGAHNGGCDGHLGGQGSC